MKRRVCGNSAGRAPLVKRKDQAFLSDALARKERSYAGASKAGDIDLVMELDICLTLGQARQNLNRTLI